jgi:hypothetical protein
MLKMYGVQKIREGGFREKLLLLMFKWWKLYGKCGTK